MATKTVKKAAPKTAAKSAPKTAAKTTAKKTVAVKDLKAAKAKIKGGRAAIIIK